MLLLSQSINLNTVVIRICNYAMLELNLISIARYSRGWDSGVVSSRWFQTTVAELGYFCYAASFPLLVISFARIACLFWNHKAKFLYFIFRKLITVWLMYTTNNFSSIRDSLFYFRGNLIFIYFSTEAVVFYLYHLVLSPLLGATFLFFSSTLLFVLVSSTVLKVTHFISHIMQILHFTKWLRYKMYRQMTNK